MSETMIAVGIALYLLFGNVFGGPTPSSNLPELDESQVKVYWIEQHEPAPFDGILLNEYTYERIRLTLIEHRGY